MKSSKELLKALIPLIAVIVLFALVGKFAIAKAVDYNNQIKVLEKDRNTLTEKLSLLKIVADSFSEGATTVSLALPSQNPSIMTISQLKNLSAQTGIAMLGMKAGAEVKDNSGLKRVDISFEVDGAKPDIIEFVNKIKTISPITIVDKIKISEVNGATRANVTVKSFWADLPKTIPNLTQQVTDLTDKEEQTLMEVSLLTTPSFFVTEASEENVIADPFNP